MSGRRLVSITQQGLSTAPGARQRGIKALVAAIPRPPAQLHRVGCQGVVEVWVQLLWSFQWVHLLMCVCQAMSRALKLLIQAVQLLEHGCIRDTGSEVQHCRDCCRQEVQAGHNEKGLPAEWRAGAGVRIRLTAPDAAGGLHSTWRVPVAPQTSANRLSCGVSKSTASCTSCCTVRTLSAPMLDEIISRLFRCCRKAASCVQIKCHLPVALLAVADLPRMALGLRLPLIQLASQS